MKLTVNQYEFSSTSYDFTFEDDGELLDDCPYVYVAGKYVIDGEDFKFCDLTVKTDNKIGDRFTWEPKKGEHLPFLFNPIHELIKTWLKAKKGEQYAR